MRVWTGVALTDAELRTERDSATAVRTSGLWADWPLANSTDTGDDSGNGRDLTFGGTLTTETGPLAGDFTVSKSEGVTVGESRAVAVSEAQVSKTENVTLGETAQAYLNTETSKSENITLGEAAAVVLADALAVSKSENVTLGETAQAYLGVASAARSTC